MNNKIILTIGKGRKKNHQVSKQTNILQENSHQVNKAIGQSVPKKFKNLKIIYKLSRGDICVTNLKAPLRKV